MLSRFETCSFDLFIPSFSNREIIAIFRYDDRAHFRREEKEAAEVSRFR